MKFLFASDSFKGTLSSQKTAELLTKAAREIFPDCRYDSIVVADGGEGTTDAVLAATNGQKISLQVQAFTDMRYQIMQSRDLSQDIINLTGSLQITLG